MIQDLSKNNNSADDQKIYGIGIATIIANLLISSFFGMGTYMMYKEVKNDAYISVIIGIITSILPLVMLLIIKNKSEGKNIVELNVSLFGKVFGNILNILVNVTYFFTAIVIFYNMTGFFNLHYLPDTSKIYIEILLLLVIAYASSKSSHIISKISQIIFIINTIFFILCQIGIFEEFQIDRVYPILKDGMNPVINASLKYFIMAAFPIFLVTIIPNYEIYTDRNNNKRITILYFLIQICIFVIVFTTILVLGENTLLLYRYPEYMGLKTFSLFNIIERVEDTLSLQFLFSMFIFIVMCFYFIIRSVKKVVNSNIVEKLFPYILCVLLLISTNFIFKSIIESLDIILVYFPYIALVGIILPMVITFIGLLVKDAIMKNKLKATKLKSTIIANN